MQDEVRLHHRQTLHESPLLNRLEGAWPHDLHQSLVEIRHWDMTAIAGLDCCRSNAKHFTYCQVPNLATRIATTSSGAGSAYAQSRAVSLDMAQTLAMVALLGYSMSEWFASIYPRVSNSLLSVVRGCGQPFDSWPFTVVRNSPSENWSSSSQSRKYELTGLFAWTCY